MSKPDPDAMGAVGVDEMLAEIVPLSEEKRVSKVLKGYEGGKGTWGRRHVCSSYYAFKSFINIMCGIAEPELRNANRKVFCLSFLSPLLWRRHFPCQLRRVVGIRNFRV